MAVSSERAGSKPLIEKRSIDYIPEAERHGRLLSQFTLWLGANLQITAIVTGALAVVLGGDVFWSLIGLLIGQLLGGGVMALHAAQGPQLGLPQMISSRVQFGVYGAVIPLVLVCLMYIGFSASGSLLAGQAVAQLLHVEDWVGIVLFARLIMVFTIFGYRVIHGIGRIASVLGVIAFVYLFYKLLAGNDIMALLGNKHFSLAELPVGGIAVGLLADRVRPLRGGLLALPAAQHLGGENLLGRGPGFGASARRRPWCSVCLPPPWPVRSLPITKCRSSSASVAPASLPRCCTSRWRSARSP